MLNKEAEIVDGFSFTRGNSVKIVFTLSLKGSFLNGKNLLQQEQII